MSPAKGGCVHFACSPGGTTSVWPAKTKCGLAVPMRAHRFSTGAVPGSAKVTRWTSKPAALSTPSIRPSAPPSAGVTDGQRTRSRASAIGSAVGKLIVAALPGAPRWRQCACPRGLSPALGRCAQRIGAISIGPYRPAQATELDEGPNADAEADGMQEEEFRLLHAIGGRAQNCRQRVEHQKPPCGLVAIVEALGAEGETDPDQRDVQEDEDRYRHGEEFEPVFSKRGERKQEQKDEDHRHSDHHRPIGFAVEATLEREQQLHH